jgi:hypothetical protein
MRLGIINATANAMLEKEYIIATSLNYDIVKFVIEKVDIS